MRGRDTTIEDESMARLREQLVESLERNIVSNLKRLRAMAGITQGRMAKNIGVPRTSYLRIESGGRKITLVEAELAARLLRVDLSVLLLHPPVS